MIIESGFRVRDRVEISIRRAAARKLRAPVLETSKSDPIGGVEGAWEEKMCPEPRLWAFFLNGSVFIHNLFGLFALQ